MKITCLGGKIKCYFEAKQTTKGKLIYLLLIFGFLSFLLLIFVHCWSCSQHQGSCSRCSFSSLASGVIVVTFSSPCFISRCYLSLILSVKCAVVPSAAFPLLLLLLSQRFYHIKDAPLIPQFCCVITLPLRFPRICVQTVVPPNLNHPFLASGVMIPCGVFDRRKGQRFPCRELSSKKTMWIKNIC